MVRYHNFDVVFAEIPGETTLALNITGCPNRCPGCPQPALAGGRRARARRGGTAGAAGPLRTFGDLRRIHGRRRRAAQDRPAGGTVRKTCPELRTAWYSGREELPEGFEAAAFDYVKLGGWVEALGPLTAPTTNQRLYRSDRTGRWRTSRSCSGASRDATPVLAGWEPEIQRLV